MQPSKQTAARADILSLIVSTTRVAPVAVQLRIQVGIVADVAVVALLGHSPLPTAAPGALLPDH